MERTGRWGWDRSKKDWQVGLGWKKLIDGAGIGVKRIGRWGWDRSGKDCS